MSEDEGNCTKLLFHGHSSKEQIINIKFLANNSNSQNIYSLMLSYLQYRGIHLQLLKDLDSRLCG
jgi:hypothetical protein